MQTSKKTSQIKWTEWGSDAFRKATAENKPILLAISAVWCHWCHVQDNTTYSDPEVVRLVNRDYVAIRVDNDKRPDINRRYNMGGWPTTAFLTPSGDMIAGGTYIPPDQMKDHLRKVRDHYLKHKDEPASRIPSKQQLDTLGSVELSKGIVDDILGSVVINFDSKYGGFGDEPKFPQTDALELSLAQYWCTGDEGLLTIVTKTLDNMAAGGIYDHEEGAFFRYSTTRDWSIPHYEKMCEDNAKLLTLYVHAYQVTGREKFRKVAAEIIQYINTTLSDQEKGGFYGSQDADEEYYKLPKAQRSTLKAPYVDKTIYTNWTGMMISAYLKAAPILGNSGTRDFALKSIERLLREGYAARENAMYHYISEGVPQLQGLLTDQVTFCEALIDAYQTTGDGMYINHAEKLARYIDKTLLDLRGGGYYDSPHDTDPLGYLRHSVKPIDENSVAGEVLSKLHSITGVDTYLQRARSTLESLAAQYGNLAYMASTYALALDLFLNEPSRIVIVGPRSDPTTQQLHDASLRAYDPRKLVIPLDSATDTESLNRLGYPGDVEPRAYICFGKTCLQPVSEPAEITRQLLRKHD